MSMGYPPLADPHPGRPDGWRAIGSSDGQCLTQSGEVVGGAVDLWADPQQRQSRRIPWTKVRVLC